MLGLALDQADHRHRVHVGFFDELHAPAAGTEVELADAEAGGVELQFGGGEQVPGGIGQQPEAVDHLHLQLAQGIGVAGGTDALVQGQARVRVGQVVVGDQRGHVQVDVGAVAVHVVDVGQLAGLDRGHRAFQQVGVQAEADFGHLPALAFAEQFPGAADLEVVGGEGEAGAEFVHRGDGVQPLLRIRRDRAPVGDGQVGVGAVVAAADAAAQLVQLGQAELVGAVDDDGVGVGDVDPGFDDGRAQQHVEALLVEVEHHPLQLAFRHLPVGDADARVRHQRLQLVVHAADAFDVVVQEVHLAAARQFALERLAQQRLVPGVDEGLHGQPVGRRGGDDGEVAQTGHRHVQRARDRGGGQREQVHVGAQLLQRLFLAHAEALFLVDDDQPQVREPHVRLQQAVGADDHVELAFGEPLQFRVDLLLRLEAREHFHLQRPVGEAVAEVAVVLFGEQGGRHQHRDLLAGRGGDERGAHRDFGLAETDVAADHPVHRLRAGEVADHRFDRGVLVRGFLEREGRGERFVHHPVDIDRQALARLAPGLDLQQFGGDVADLLGCLLLRLRPLLATEVVQRRGVRVGAGIAADPVQLRDRHVQAVALGVFDVEELAGHAADVHRQQPAVAADAVVFVHDRCAQRELAEVADDRLGFAAGALAAARLRGAFGEQLAFGEHAQGGIIEREAVVERGHRDGELAGLAAGRRGQTDQASIGERLGQPPAPRGEASGERRPVREHLGLQSRRLQHFQHGLAPAGRIGGDQHAAGVVRQEVAQRLRRGLVLGRQRQRWRGLQRQRVGVGVARMGAITDLDALATVECFAQRVRRQPQFGGRQQRAFDVVAQLVMAHADLRPGVFGGLEHALAEHRQHAAAEVVEQGRGAGVEQRQVVLDAGRGQARLQVLHQRAAAGIDVEAVAQCVQRAPDRGLVQRDLAPGQQFDAFDAFKRALRFRVERTDRIDFVVEQLDPERHLGAHREHVEQAAAHREVAGVEHLRRVPVAGGFEAALLGVQVELLAEAEIEAVADHVGKRGDALHQGGDRHHHDPALQSGQAGQGRQALADDVRMRAETVVGQGFPIGEGQHRQRGVAAEQGVQVGFQLVRGVVVARDQQQRCAMLGGGRGDRHRQRTGRGWHSPVRAQLAGLRQRQGREIDQVGHRHQCTAVPGTWRARQGVRSLARRCRRSGDQGWRGARLRLRQVQHHPHQPGRMAGFPVEIQRGRQCLHRQVALQHVAVDALQLAALGPAHQPPHQVAAQAHAVDVVADQDREFAGAAVIVHHDPCHRADQRLARRQRFGGHQREFAAGVGSGQAFGLLGAELLHRVQEAHAHFVRLQQGEAGTQRHRVLGADRADQDVAAIAEADVLVPRGHAVAGGHFRIIARSTLKM